MAYTNLKLRIILHEVYWELNYLEDSIAQNMIINNVNFHSA